MPNQSKHLNPPRLRECNLDLVKLAFSKPRMSKYLNAVLEDDQKVKNAMRLYQINMLYSEALYPSLHSLEIALRNSIDSSLSQHNKYWLIPNKSFFEEDNISEFIEKNVNTFKMPNNTKSILLEKEEKKVFKAIEELIISKKKKESYYRKIDFRLTKVDFNVEKSRENIIANLSLGFWTTLITHTKSRKKDQSKKENYFNKIFVPYIKEIFPNAKNRERTPSNIKPILEDIRELRNRVFHHEPVWGYYDKLEKKHKDIMKVIDWIDPNIKLWLNSSDKIDRFPEIYSQYSQEVIEITKFKK